MTTGISFSDDGQQQQQRITGNVAQFINQFDVHAVDFDSAESYILQAVAQYKTTCHQLSSSSPANSTTSTTIRTMNDTTGDDAYKVLIYAQLGLGQIAAYQGRYAQASVLLLDLLLDEANLLDESNRILRMIAWYDLGMIWFHQDCPHQALDCFREALGSVSTEYILLTIAAAAAASSPSTTSEEEYRTQESLLNFIPILMDHVDYLMACINNNGTNTGSVVNIPNEQRDHNASSFSTTTSTTTGGRVAAAAASGWSVGDGEISSTSQLGTNNRSLPITPANPSSTTPEAMTFLWSLEILLPPGQFQSATTTTTTSSSNSNSPAFFSDESTMMEVDGQDQHHHHQLQQHQPTVHTDMTTTDGGDDFLRQCQPRRLTVQELLWMLSEWGLCAAAA